MQADGPGRPSEALARLRSRYSRVAIAHDWLTVPGGSEQVLLELLQMFPRAEVFTSVYDPGPWPAQLKERPVHASFLDRIPGARRRYQLLLPLMNAAFRRFDLSRFDLVLSSSHACAKNVRVPRSALHVCYCHTPMRYAWDESFLRGEVPGPVRVLARPLLAWLRRQDVIGAAGVDAFVANSRHVAERIARHWGRSSTVVHPPVDVDRLLGLERKPGDHYLVFGRVVPYKRVDLAVEACTWLDRHLVVAGSGRALPALRALAGPRVELRGSVDAGERDRLLSGARALLFPGEEDFGIVPVEAQAAGVPVIAYGVGGARETVIDGGTGVLFEPQSADALVRAIERFEGLDLDERTLRAHARGFDRERFRAEMAGAIERAQPSRGYAGAPPSGRRERPLGRVGDVAGDRER
jgi:glycosyltransferase involved in cell wall biosynthesis